MANRLLGAANALVYLALGLLVALHLDDLRWAVEVGPGYLAGSIATPTERALLHAGRAQRAGDRHRAELAPQTLERSLAIDPYGEARLVLAEWLFDRERLDEALEQFERYRAFDPTVAQVYLKISAIHERAGRRADALLALDEGARYFARNAEKFRPVPDDDVPSRFNRKAARVYDYYRSSRRFLEFERERIAARPPQHEPARGAVPPGEPPPAVGGPRPHEGISGP